MRRLMLVLAVVLAGACGTYASAETLEGRFLGVDGADGFTITLTPDGEQFTGTLVGRDGTSAPIAAKAVGGGAQAPMTLGGRKGFARIAPQPVGLSLVWMPLDDSGRPIRDDAQIYTFRRDNIALPQASRGYRPPPPPGKTRTDPIAFINSYEFWTPADAARVYDRIDPKHRSLMRLFPYFHADVLWRLCESPLPPAALGEALRGESLVCSDVDARVKAGQKNGRFSEFKRRVATERQYAAATVGCALGLFTNDVCSGAARATQRAALSLDTASSVLGAMR